MRQASWEEMFRHAELSDEPKKSRLSWLSRYLNWEDLITLVIVLIAFLTVVGSINGANWVAEMPSLFPIAFLGLVIGLLLARSPVNELVAHTTAIAIGVIGVITSGSSRLDGSRLDRAEELLDRMWIWAKAVYEGGISNDDLPFVVLVIGVTYLAAYLAAWSLFRWYNAWIALIPAGLALLTNISYLPGQHATPMVIFLFCAILLVARINLLRSARQWRKEHAGYPDLISLHVLNVTVWVAVALLGLAWIMPVGSGSGALFSLWQKITAPVAEPLSDFGRVFAAIDSKKGGTVHDFGSTLPLQGEISFGGGEVMLVTTTEAGFLRAQSYDQYTAQGWKLSSASQITTQTWPALRAMGSVDETRRQLRRPVSVLVSPSRKASALFSAGQPLAATVDARVVFGPDLSDITSIRPLSGLDEGSQYRVDSTVTNASIERLRSASNNYPGWLNAYRQLPSDLPERVKAKARELTAGATNAYDQAILIEAYIRSFVIDTEIKPAPSRRDSVDYFLFDIQRGYFDYHASAMVVMLRSLGVPARMTVGYVLRPEDREAGTNVYRVTESSAFAWPEVFFPGLGWVEFNPTPSEPRITRPGTDDLALDLDDQFPLEEEFLPVPDFGDTEPAAAPVDDLAVDEGTSVVSQAIISLILLFLGITIVGGGIFQWSWQHGLRGLPYPVQVWEKTMRLARWARIPLIPQETPRELTGRLKKELPEVSDIDYLAEQFQRARYGQKELAPAERERLNAVWKKVRGNLFSRIFRWK